MSENEWVFCPICGGKTRIMINRRTKVSNFPLFCPKCKRQALIDITDMKLTYSQ